VLHGAGVLHADDPQPVHIYAETGDISGFTLFSAKAARVVSGHDITDIALYIQNTNANDFSVVSAGRDIIAYDPDAPLVRLALTSLYTTVNPALAGDIQISGPGTIEVLAGRNLNLGIGPVNADGTAEGLTSTGNAQNPYLPFGGANIIAAAGVAGSSGLGQSNVDFAAFIDAFLNPEKGASEAARYLPYVATLLNIGGESDTQVWDAFRKLSAEKQDSLALDVFYRVLRDAGRDHNLSGSPGFGNYSAGFAAIHSLFPGNSWLGDISLTSREIKTVNGGDISLLAPGGKLNVGFPIPDQPVDQGILTEDGGSISIFANSDVTVGTSRIFTLRGGNEIIWSSAGNIAAGSAAKTVVSAPPTRVIVDPQSGDVQNDLAGLATGGGIGVLASVAGVAPGDVDLIAPTGTIDAGDAGIRVSGNLNLAAVTILNASNIQVGGVSSGSPATAVNAPSIAAIAPTSNNATTGANTAADAAKQAQNQNGQQGSDMPSLISVEVVGYGGGDGPTEPSSAPESQQPAAPSNPASGEQPPASAEPPQPTSKPDSDSQPSPTPASGLKPGNLRDSA